MCKCIYCNSQDLTISDIIPYALTGAKLTKKFVCHEHNDFTNVNFEKVAISNFDFFRNSLGLTERSGNDIKYRAELTIEDITIPNVAVSDRRSIYEDKKRLFQVEHDGKKVIVGNIDKLKQKKDVDPQKIESLDLNDVTVSVRFSLEDLFASDEMLRTVAKIAYEWFCFANDITHYEPTLYQDIVDCILLKQPVNDYVKIVDNHIMETALQDICYYGSHGLFEYNDIDGFKYVIYCFWGIIYYKVRICKLDKANNSTYNRYSLYLYDVDGTKRNLEFATCGISTFSSVSAQEAIKNNRKIYVSKLQKLIQTTIWTFAKAQQLVNDLNKAVKAYKNPPHDFARLVDYEDNERVVTIQIVLYLYSNKEQYDFTKSFTDNMKMLYSVDDTIVINTNENKKYVAELMKSHNDGSLLDRLERAIDFFGQIVANEP